MKISIVVAAYCSSVYLRKLVASSFEDDRHDVNLWIYTHSGHKGMLKAIENCIGLYPIRLFDYRENRGLARSWNDGIFGAYEDGADVVIVANDDVYFSNGDIDRIAKKAVKCRKNYMVSVAGGHDYLGEFRISHGYSCFAINPIALEKIGAFDQNYYPAYCEDLDHHRRATMLGLVETNCSDTNVVHGGSMTIQGDEELSLANMVTQPKNITFFRTKWDSDSHEGGYKCPFGESRFGLYIDPQSRENPYPGYNRTDVPWLGRGPDE